MQITYESLLRFDYNIIESARPLSAGDVVGQQTQASLFHALELAPECCLVVAKAREDFAGELNVSFADFGVGMFEVAGSSVGKSGGGVGADIGLSGAAGKQESAKSI